MHNKRIKIQTKKQLNRAL